MEMSRFVLGFWVFHCYAYIVSACDKTVYICEHFQDTVTCPPGKVLEVSSAFYGRKETNRCGYSANTACVAQGSLAKIRGLCQGQNSCTLSAYTSVFGNACPGVDKYIQITYKCVDQVRYIARSMVVCEHAAAETITCPAGEVIIVTAGFYGRDEGEECPGNVFTTSCAADGSLDILRRTCNNRQSCTVSATNSIFGDPCLYTNKLIRMEYYCVTKAPQAIEVRTAMACQYKEDVPVTCPEDDVIIVADGFYGRDDATPCPGNVFTTNCKAEGAKDYLKCSCNNEPSCILQASNSVFGNPCRHTTKFARLDYYCVPNPHRRLAVACEHHAPVTVQCPGNLRISVTDGFYGRDEDATTCPGDFLTTDCAAAGSLSILKAACDNRNSCAIHASNDVFGDPCLGTVKLIRMHYLCI